MPKGYKKDGSFAGRVYEKGNPKPKNAYSFLSGNFVNSGRKPSIETKKRMSEIHKKLGSGDRLPSMLGKKFSLEHRRKISVALKGENNSLWKGGRCPEERLIRESLEYRLWHASVLVRDHWTCQDCGQKNGKLQVHHIKSFRDFPELRTAIDNGITLCVPCHGKTKRKNRVTL